MLAGASREDRRALGLFGLLRNDWALCLKAWAVLQLSFLGSVVSGSLAAESAGTWSRGRQS